ncbi:DUF4255 domain-containing protein [Pseudenhygromyxa sp. WMMC2535]|uniref:DUF4255 domain-containing protein n=1 Tax=Pseudenhygromyxa sp. WMMC2535 TaxID=2712867 RepID=UPI0015540DF6|nr:DUF4255 domain-containing protein [Pseudenhygromyxa sp. WMMC2535]NVB36425.1 DUF4255 domain-containing protein [Pseudenhygromyxa sp. WMMC2535]
MALLDISLVTSALMTLLKQNIDNNIDSGVDSLTVTPEAPDKVGTVLNHLSVYLYHVAEEAFFKTQPAPGGDARSIATTPMGLCLYYVLTAHHDSGNAATDCLTQQKLMGYALKTMHDYPIVHDDTEIASVSILPNDMLGEGNPLQIIMRPVTPEDTLAFWGTEDQQTARLSAYYEVRVIMLEPEQPETWAAPVLSLGTYLYQLGTPHLERSRSELAFTLPASGGGLDRVVEVSPARASGDNSGSPDHHLLELLGSNLSMGQAREVWLSSALINHAAGGALAVDLSLSENQSEGWALSIDEGRLELALADFLYYDEGASSVAMLPGLYTAFVRITVGERVVGGQLVPITHDSNAVAFTLIPWIAGISQDADQEGDQVFSLSTAGFDLQDADLVVQLYVDGLRYEQVTTIDSGSFVIAGASTLSFRQALSAGEHTLRLIINGAESQPFWFESV